MRRSTAGCCAVAVYLLVLLVLPVWGGTLTVRVPQAQVRKGPGPTYPVLTSAPHGTIFPLLMTSQGWHKILLADGREGWIADSVGNVEHGPRPFESSPLSQQPFEGERQRTEERQQLTETRKSGKTDVVEMKDPARAFEADFLVVKGEGIASPDVPHAGQRRILALRAAQVMAYRELLEAVKGIQVAGTTTVAMAMLASDEVRTRVEGKVQGAQTIYKRYDAQMDRGIVYVRLPLRGVGSVSAALLPELKAASIPPHGVPYHPPPISLSAPRQPFDSLIVDVRGYVFRPALLNRILTPKGKVVYDPSTMAEDILVRRGAGDYTTARREAETLLAANGANHPLTVKATGVVEMTSVQVSEPDATTIFVANQHTSFLKKARVVFVWE